MCKGSYLSKDKILLVKELKEKAGFVKWFNKQRKEHYGVIARKIENKKGLRKKGYLIYDLNDWK